MKHELKKGNMLVLLVKEDDSNFCCGMDEKESELNELENKLNKKIYLESIKKNKDICKDTTITLGNESKSIKSSNIKLNDLSLSEINSEKPKQKKKQNCLYTFYLLFKSFFIKEYWFCTFINKEEEISKTNILTIFVIHLISSLAVSSIFTECSNSNEDSYTFNNRDIAVSIVTILILEIPFTTFEMLLGKTKIILKDKQSIRKYKSNTLFKHITVYIIVLHSLYLVLSILHGYL